jgi:hypothetical protein
MGKLVRLIGSGIGLASEAIASRKAEKADNAAAASTQPQSRPEVGESSRKAAQRATVSPDEAPPSMLKYQASMSISSWRVGKQFPMTRKKHIKSMRSNRRNMMIRLLKRAMKSNEISMIRCRSNWRSHRRKTSLYKMRMSSWMLS